MNMKSLRISILILAFGAISTCSIPVHAQQEVDPDHFDQPSLRTTHARGLKTQDPYNSKAKQHPSEKKLAGASSRNTHHGQSAHHSTSSPDTAGK
jgi:hypothetical protein